MPKAFAPALVAVSLTGLVAIKDVGPGATMADTGEKEPQATGGAVFGVASSSPMHFVRLAKLRISSHTIVVRF